MGVNLRSPDDRVIIKSLEGFLSQMSGRKVTIPTLHRTPGEQSTSFRSEVLHVDLNGGSKLKIFLKDFGYSRLPKDGLEQRRERELRVYQDVIRKANLGTAKFYGSIWDESTGRYWLLLEFVEGDTLRDREFDDWVRAVGWLGGMQNYFAQHNRDLETSNFLVTHDSEFFWSKVDLASRSVYQISSSLADRLGHVLKRYSRIVDVMTHQPRTFVHGSFRPQNILVAATEEGVRICPIDWELAAYGAPLYDFAFLADGFKPPELDRLWDVYLQQFTDIPPHNQDQNEMTYIVDCFRLHKLIKSLSDSLSWKFPEETVAKLVGMVEELGRLLGLV